MEFEVPSCTFRVELGPKAINAAGQSNLLIQKCPGSKVSSGPKSRFFRHTDIPTIYEKYYRTCIFRTKKTKTDFRSNIVLKIPTKINFKICDTGTLKYEYGTAVAIHGRIQPVQLYVTHAI